MWRKEWQLWAKRRNRWGSLATIVYAGVVSICFTGRLASPHLATSAFPVWLEVSPSTSFITTRLYLHSRMRHAVLLLLQRAILAPVLMTITYVFHSVKQNWSLEGFAARSRHCERLLEEDDQNQRPAACTTSRTPIRSTTTASIGVRNRRSYTGSSA